MLGGGRGQKWMCREGDASLSGKGRLGRNGLVEEG